MKTSSLLLRTLFVAALAFVLSGCVAAIGNREPAKSTATLGQQLIDLQRAKESGALSDAEYQAQRAKFLEGR